VVSCAAGSVRGPAIGLAIAVGLVIGACSGSASSSDSGPPDAGRDNSIAVPDALADAGDALADAGNGRADAPIAADAPADEADAPALADLGPDGTTDTHADLTSGVDAPADAPADMPPLPGCASAGNILCETFESTLPGGLPTASPWLDHPAFGICDSNSTLAVDVTHAHRGTRGLTSHSFSNQCVLEADLGVHPELWVRAWVLLDAPGPGQVDAGRVDVSEMTLFGIGANQFGDDPRIAVGYAGTIDFSPCSQRPGISVNTTGSSAAAGCTGAALPTGQWLCFELHVMQAGSTVHAQLYLDGELQSFASPSPDGGSIDTVTNIYGATVRYLTLGVRQYGSRYVTPAYYDDVAAGTERIGCNN